MPCSSASQLTFRTNISLPSSWPKGKLCRTLAWRWRRYIRPKSPSTFTGFHCDISQKKEIFMVSISQHLFVLAECFNGVVHNMLDDWASNPCRKKNIRFDTAVSRLFLELYESMGTPMSLRLFNTSKYSLIPSSPSNISPWCGVKHSATLIITLNGGDT
jgi:hypothetical protein